MSDTATGPASATLAAIAAEVLAARRKFPSNAHMCVALTEEVGELAEALLKYGNSQRAREEAIQVACVAIRIIEEGDADFDEVFGEEGSRDNETNAKLRRNPAVLASTREAEATVAKWRRKAPCEVFGDD